MATRPRAPAAALQYQISAPDPRNHRFQVRLRIAQPAALQKLSLPVWIPGSYLVREFAKNLLQLSARQGQQALAIEQLDKCSWQVACTPGRALELNYEVYAFDNSVRSAWLDSARAFFNATSLCLRVEGQTDGAHELLIKPGAAMAGWSVATSLNALAVDERGFGRYGAADYDELADCPVELGAFWRGEFKAGGVPHSFVVAGAPPAFNGARLLADAQKICETAIAFWHGAPADKNSRKRSKPPFRHYLFLLNAVDDSYGGLEHRSSTALICNRRDLPRLAGALDSAEPKQPEGYTTLLGLISHEYFHTWNVKRLRPAEFGRYRYDTENYSQLLWFFEGFTSYYDDLLLRRAGLIDDAVYLKLLAKTINQVAQTPGRQVQSVAQASFDAWIKYYRVDENTPNATVSYYTKGALVALCLDLRLRAEGRSGLDALMRGLWQRCQGGPMTEADFAAELAEQGGRNYSAEISAWVHGTDELPLKELLQGQGLLVLEEAAALAQQLGLRVSEGASISIKNVLRGGLAEQAGFAPGDEWLAVDDWRLGKLDDLLLYAGPARKLTALVARDRRLLRLPLTLPEAGTLEASRSVWRLAVQDRARVGAWLNG